MPRRHFGYFLSPKFIKHNVGWLAKHTPPCSKISNRLDNYCTVSPKIYVKNAQDFEKLRRRRIEFAECKGIVHDDEQKIQDDIQSCFREFLSVKNLLLSEISLSSSDDVLQNYVDFETVLEKANDMSTLSKRLGYGRRVYSLNHPLLGTFPLAFVNVGLTRGVADSLMYIEKSTGTLELEKKANTAMFYSICTAPGLHGFSLGNCLIKLAVEKLNEDIFFSKTSAQFSTLSPIPKFRAWLEDQEATDILGILVGDQHFDGGKHGAEHMYELYEGGMQFTKSEMLNSIYSSAHGKKENLFRLPLVAHYLIDQKKKTNRERAMCPVANFHLSNGAEMYRLNCMGDPSSNGINRSFGTMVNYLYNLDMLEENSRMYRERGVIKSHLSWGL